MEINNIEGFKLPFKNNSDSFVIFKVESNIKNELLELNELFKILKYNYAILYLLESAISNKYEIKYISKYIGPAVISNKESENIKIYRISKQSPLVIEYAIKGFQLGFKIAELLDVLLKYGLESEHFRRLLSRYNIQADLVERISNDLHKVLEKLGPLNRIVTIFYGLNLNTND